MTELVCALCLSWMLIDLPLTPVALFVSVGLLALMLLCAAFAELRDSRLGRATVAVLIGFVAVSIGVGYAAARLLEGAWLIGLVGVLGAALGVVLCVGAAVAFVRTTHSWWRLAAGLAVTAAIAAALQLGVMPLAAATFGIHPPRMPIVATPPPAARSVTFATPDGVEIGGWYMPTANGATVILLPGALGNRGDTVDHARVLAANGYGVLAVDARGSGESGPFGNMWGWSGTADIAGALDWLNAQPDADPSRVGLVGVSMGGEQALTAAANVAVSARVAAVVAEGVEARVPADLWFVSDDLLGTIERTVSNTMWWSAALATGLDAPASLRDVASTLNGTPALLIAADADDERSVAADLAERSAAIAVWQTTDIGHTQALSIAPAEWEARVINFLDRELLQR